MAAERTERTKRIRRAEETERAEELLRGAFDHVGAFEVRGVLDTGAQSEEDECVVTVGWEDGEIYGDEAALILMRMRARVFDGSLIGPSGGPYTETAEGHLGSPGSAYELMKMFLNKTSVIKGEAPRPRTPYGMIR